MVFQNEAIIGRQYFNSVNDRLNFAVAQSGQRNDGAASYGPQTHLG